MSRLIMPLISLKTRSNSTRRSNLCPNVAKDTELIVQLVRQALYSPIAFWSIVMAHSLHYNPLQTSAVHRQSMIDSLQHRLETAQTNRDRRLLELLEHEKHQLIDEAYQLNLWQALQSGFTSIQKGINRVLFGGSSLQVNEFDVGSDHFWYAKNPMTGECVYADSESELRLWIEENYSER